MELFMYNRRVAQREPLEATTPARPPFDFKKKEKQLCFLPP